MLIMCNTIMWILLLIHLVSGSMWLIDVFFSSEKCRKVLMANQTTAESDKNN